MAKLGAKSTAKDVVDRFAPDRQLAGRVAVVTGGNSGIGLETVKALALGGCSVVLASRSVQAGEKAVAEEVRLKGLGGYSVPDAAVVVEQLDLNDLSSVLAFAKRVRETQPRIDYLVLNAGIMALPQLERTADGFEKQIGVNHFGHALLVRLLRPTLEAQQFPSRIVTLASSAHNLALKEFSIEDLHFNSDTAKYTAWGAYGNSKLANVLYAKALVKRLPADGRISSVSLHPGVIKTALWRSTPAASKIGGWLLDLTLSNKNIPQGAATTVWACLGDEPAGASLAGAYLSDCAVGKKSSRGQDDALAEALWATTDSQLDAALAKKGFAPNGEALESSKTRA